MSRYAVAVGGPRTVTGGGSSVKKALDMAELVGKSLLRGLLTVMTALDQAERRPPWDSDDPRTPPRRRQG
jgi:hypothetical protein